MRSCFVAIYVLSQVVVIALAPVSASAASCGFALGFKTIHGLIPGIVGTCLTDEQHGVNGDGLQQTTRGLLVWRKVDNFTAFTDGFHSWVNGPFGLQERLNSQRFSWENELSPDTLKNATYQLPILEGQAPVRFTLENGEVTLPAQLGTVTFVDRTLAYGKVNADAALGSAFVLAHNGGGSGVFEYLVTVRDVNGAPRQIDTEFLGDRPRVNSIILGDNRVTVYLLVQGPNEGACCPTQPVVQSYPLPAP